jgi:hypothetical protein
MFLRLALIHSIFFRNGYISNITPDFYHISLLFSRSILTSKEIDGKTYSETEQNMSEKQGKGQIMLHLPMEFENHVMNRENKFSLFFSVGSSC